MDIRLSGPFLLHQGFVGQAGSAQALRSFSEVGQTSTGWHPQFLSKRGYARVRRSFNEAWMAQPKMKT